METKTTTTTKTTNPCPCGRDRAGHCVFFAGMMTNKTISASPSLSSSSSSTTTTGKVSNFVCACSHPDIQIKCYNRQEGYEPFDATLNYGAPSWKWQILVGPFVDSRAREFVQSCQRQSRKPMPRLIKMIQLAHIYNTTTRREGETPLVVYLVGDIQPSDL